jgi:endonuclease/exonuclease/phosphatase family metal-dependent hydrolase
MNKAIPRGQAWLRRAAATALLLAVTFGAAGQAAAQSSVFVDVPRANSTVAPDFHLGGWAIDWAARQTTGVMTIHVWAYPSTGAPPIFLGVPSRGARSDIGRAFGQNFLNCGFGLNVRGLAPGDYVIAIFPFSDIRGAFDYDSAMAIPVTVRRPSSSSRPAPAPAPAPDPAPSPNPDPAPSSSGSTLRVLHWNIHHGTGTDGDYNLERIADVIADANPDVVSLNEVERYTGWGNEDQPARLASLLRSRTGRTWHYHFASRSGASQAQGNLLLSRFPIESSGSHLLSHTRSVAQIRITVNGRSVNLFSTHLDSDSSGRRSTQMNELKRWSEGFPEQRIIAGDFNTWPSAGEIGSMTGTYRDVWADAATAGTATAYAGNTNGATRNSRIDYIFFSRGASRTDLNAARVFDISATRASDHRPLMATFAIR